MASELPKCFGRVSSYEKVLREALREALRQASNQQELETQLRASMIKTPCSVPSPVTPNDNLPNDPQKPPYRTKTYANTNLLSHPAPNSYQPFLLITSSPSPSSPKTDSAYPLHAPPDPTSSDSPTNLFHPPPNPPYPTTRHPPDPARAQPTYDP